MHSLDERIIIRTPEALDVELTLAGIGSRGLAQIVDLILKLGLMFLASIPLRFGTGGLAITLPLIFAVFFGYAVFFEVRRSGRTPGKRTNGIRVVSLAGGPVTFRQSALRSMLSLLDVITFSLAALVSIIATEKNQRLGDLVAGTVVIRDAFGEVPDSQKGVLMRPIHIGRRQKITDKPLPSGLGLLSGYQVSSVTDDELTAVRRFLERRAALPTEARTRLAEALAAGIASKVPAIPQELSAERFLEEVAMARSGLT